LFSLPSAESFALGIRPPRPRYVADVLDRIRVRPKHLDECEFRNTCFGVAAKPPFEGLLCISQLIVGSRLHWILTQAQFDERLHPCRRQKNECLICREVVACFGARDCYLSSVSWSISARLALLKSSAGARLRPLIGQYRRDSDR